MNIHNFESPTNYPENMLEDIFNKQRELAHKYHPIEKSNGFRVGDGLVVNLHDKFGQHRIKDFSWRVTEELMEALEAWYDDDEDHCQEEVADALHFFVELAIICDMSHELFMFDTLDPSHQPVDSYDIASGQVVYCLGLACNCLKNKPWKQTQMKTDENKFKSMIMLAFDALMRAAKAAGISSQEHMYDLYFRKNKVNQFRQESKY